MAKKKHKKDPAGWEIKRYRNGDEHIQSCTSGYFKASKTFRQIHHVLPVTTLSDGTISQEIGNDKEKLEVIRNCLMCTAWNINAAPNCVGLPLKPAYHHKRAPPNWDNCPSHQVDHPQYTTEVSTYLKDNVWDPICEAAKECEEFVSSLVGELEDASNHWRDQLSARGRRPAGAKGGTRYCWEHREEPAMKTQWYLPFSMAASPTPRSPPPADFSGSMKAYMKTIFAALG